MKAIGIVLITLLLVSPLFGGVTGKIAGRVTDARTGEELPGVNIVIEGTTLGAATDFDGYYTILNIPAGSYTVKVSMMGYVTESTENVTVMADLTTTLNIRLRPTVIEGEEIVVVAERPLVQKDVTASRAIVSREEIEKMPVASVNQAIVQQTGVTLDGEGYMHIRGGRETEISYMIDGCKLVDPFVHMNDTRVPESAAEEVSVYTGGFEAEYGETSSGIINVVTREGGQKLEGGVGFRTNNFGFNKSIQDFVDKNNQVPNARQQKLQELTFNLGGPEPVTTLLEKAGLNIPGRGLRFFVSSELTKDSSFIQFDDEYRRTVTGKLTYTITPALKLRVGGILDNREFLWAYGITRYAPTDNQRYSYLQWKNLYDHCPEFMREVNTGYISLNHSLSENTFYELKVDRHYTRRHWNVVEDGMFDSVWVPLPSGDTILITQPEGGDGIDDFADEDNDRLVEVNGIETIWYWSDPNFPYNFTRDQDDQNYYTSGFHRLAWQERNAETWTVKGDITSQVARSHLVKSGFEWTTNTLFQYSADMASGDNLYITDPYYAYPYSIALYATDKMEVEGMIVNAGVRLDYFSSNWPHFPTDPSHPVPDSLLNEGGVIHNPTTPKAKYQITPRLGVSYPITDMDKLHFSYGHYFQIPPLVYLYNNPWYNFAGAFPLVGNADLKAEKTISYEFGVVHAFTNYAMADVTAFYKDITDLLDTEQIYYTVANYYTRYINADFARVRGFEIALKLRPGGRFPYLSGAMNYTFSVASGKSSSERQNYDYIWSGWIVPKKEFPLNWDERHRVSMNIAFTVPKGEYLFGNRFLTDFGISTLTNFGSGMPWTPSSSTREQRINEARLPWTLITDMKLSRNFRIGGSKISLYVSIGNLFDRTDNIRILTDPAWYEAELAKAGLTEDEMISGSGYRKEKAKAAKGMWNDPFALYPRRHMDVGIEVGF